MLDPPELFLPRRLRLVPPEIDDPPPIEPPIDLGERLLGEMDPFETDPFELPHDIEWSRDLRPDLDGLICRWRGWLVSKCGSNGSHRE